MATTNRNQSGRDYQSWGEAARQQATEAREHKERSRTEDKIATYLRDHPSSSYAEAKYNKR
jgi:hypothetical protein